MQTTFRPDYHQKAPSIFGTELAAIAVAGLVGSAESPSLIAWMDLSGTTGRDMEAFRFALDMEHAYADAFTAFSEDETEPYYERAYVMDLEQLAVMFDVDRVLCVVAMTDRGDVIGGRNYDNLDLVYVDGISEEIRRLSVSLARRGQPGGAGRPN